MVTFKLRPSGEHVPGTRNNMHKDSEAGKRFTYLRNPKRIRVPGAWGGRKKAEGQSRQGPVGHGEEFSFYPKSGGNLLMGLPGGDS